MLRRRNYPLRRRKQKNGGKKKVSKKLFTWFDNNQTKANHGKRPLLLSETDKKN